MTPLCRSNWMLSRFLAAAISQLVLLLLRSPFTRAVLLTVTLSLKCLICCWLCFPSSRHDMRDITQKGQVESMEQATSAPTLGDSHKSPSQQLIDSRLGCKTGAHKSCWDSSCAFPPQREETFFSVSFAASPDARFPCVNAFLLPHTLRETFR